MLSSIRPLDAAARYGALATRRAELGRPAADFVSLARW